MRRIAVLALAVVPGMLIAQHVPVINTQRGGMRLPSHANQYGSILFPGGPSMPATGFPSRLGSTIRGGSYTGVPPGYQGRIPPRRTVVVPYAVPVFMGGGYGYGYYPPDGGSTNNVTVVVPQQPTPNVIVNNYPQAAEAGGSPVREYSGGGEQRESKVRVYEGPSSAAAAAPQPARSGRSIMDEKPTIYLIALTDGTVRQAIGYWVKGSEVHYVTPQSTIAHVAADLVDQQRSIELNAERNLDFDLRLP